MWLDVRDFLTRTMCNGLQRTDLVSHHVLNLARAHVDLPPAKAL